MLLTAKFLVLIVPFFWLALYSVSIFTDLKSNDFPETVPDLRMTKLGQGITAVTSVLGVSWSFLGMFPSTQIKHAGTFIIVGCVDFLIGILLLVAVGLQSTYLPLTSSGCNDPAYLGLSAPGNTTNLFRFAGQVSNDTPYGVCRSYVTTWIIGIALGSVSLLSSYLPIKLARDAGGSRRHSTRIGVVSCFIGLIPRFLSTPVKFAVRRSDKWRRKRTKPPTFKMANMAMAFSTPGPPDLLPSLALHPKMSSKFLELLSSYPIMTAIAEGLHYVDLIQLSLVSKEVHNAIFPPPNPAHISGLKKHCCLNGEIGTCWCCKNQVCWEGSEGLVCNPDKHCTSLGRNSMAGTTRHLDNCIPFCSKCFRTSLCRSASPRELSVQCKCTTGPVPNSGLLCRFCTKVPVYVRRQRVEKRESEKMVAKAIQQVNCDGCSKRLPQKGPRWWVCGICRKECRSPFHPQWAGGAGV